MRKKNTPIEEPIATEAQKPKTTRPRPKPVPKVEQLSLVEPAEIVSTKVRTPKSQGRKTIVKAVVEAPSVAKTEQAPVKARGRAPRKKPEPSEVVVQDLSSVAIEDTGEEFQLSWRPREPGRAKEPSQGRSSNRKTTRVREESPTKEEREPRPEAKAPRTEARRPRAKEVLERAVVIEKPVVVLPPPKPVIPTPEDAPQIVLREGLPTLVRNKRAYPPIAFFGSASDETRATTVFEQIKMAGESGVHIHSHLVEFEVDPAAVESSVAFAAYMLTKTIEADPEAQVLFRLSFIASPNWADRYPDARYIDAEGNAAEPSVCDDAFWGVARDCTQRFVRQLLMLDAKDHILGIHLERGEWFFSDYMGYDNSSAAKAKFRDWAKVRYGGAVVALRAAWFDGTANFNTLEIPRFQRHGEDPDKFVRAGRKERRWVDYHLFLSDAVVERIGDLAYATKEASEGRFLVGASYGYTFEWSHPASGHLSLGKLLRTPEIDFIGGPPSYRSREPGGAAPFPGPLDSFALNGKLYISEEDFKTAIGVQNEPDSFNPTIKTPQALENVHWRGTGAALAHGSGVCWMDVWGNGWLKTRGIWERATSVVDCLVKRMAAPLGDPDVAVFIDERALAYLVNEKAFALLVQNVRESVLRAGLSAGFYLLSDLQHRERFPEAKLYVFLNAWDIRPELRAAIKSRLQRDNKVLFWLYAAGLFDSGRESLERAREVTGIALKPQPFHSKTGTTIMNRRHVLSEPLAEKSTVGGGKLQPSYFAIPEESVVLGEYTQTGLPSFVVKEFSGGENDSDSWKSVFLGEPVVTPALLRALGQLAGAHVWNYQEDVVHVRAPFLTVHCTGTGPRTIMLPDKWSAYNLLASSWASTDTNSLKFNSIDGATHVFLVGMKEDIETILNADPVKLLTVEEMPAKTEDTVRYDASQFDVPIMKLDEWIEGSEDEDLGDDFLFKPQLVEESDTIEEVQTVGHRRRRRDRSRGGNQDGPARPRENVFEELEMNVIFRKRE